MASELQPVYWGAGARLFHWLMAAGILFMVGLGLWMTGLPLGLRKLNIYALHKSIGVTLLALALLRLLWRVRDARPAPPPGQPRWQTRIARLTHVLIYLLLFVIPLSGWVYNSAAGFPLQWFKLVSLPKLAEPDAALKATAHSVHETGVWILVALVALHVAAALKHHFIDHDQTLTAMLPGAGRGRRADDGVRPS